MISCETQQPRINQPLLNTAACERGLAADGNFFPGLKACLPLYKPRDTFLPPNTLQYYN